MAAAIQARNEKISRTNRVLVWLRRAVIWTAIVVPIVFATWLLGWILIHEIFIEGVRIGKPLAFTNENSTNFDHIRGVVVLCIETIAIYGLGIFLYFNRKEML